MHAMSPIVPRRRNGRLTLLLSVAALLLLSAGARRASADACSDCKEPTLRDLMGVPGFTLHSLPPGWFSSPSTDYVETDAGECTYTPKGDPSTTIVSSKLVLRGHGEVWNCPESSSDDEISFEIAQGDSTTWTLSAEVGVQLKAIAIAVAGKVGVSTGGGRSITEVRSVKKSLHAGQGHRIEWEGYFEVATFSLTIVFDVTRRWSWWTKNQVTGYTVLRSGSIWMSCGTETVELSRNASIGYRIHLYDRSCLEPLAPPRDLGPFPLPTTPPAGDLPGSAPRNPPPSAAPPPPPPPPPFPPGAVPPTTPPSAPTGGAANPPAPPVAAPPTPGLTGEEEEEDDCDWPDEEPAELGATLDAATSVPSTTTGVNSVGAASAAAGPRPGTCPALEITCDGTVVAVLRDLPGTGA